VNWGVLLTPGITCWRMARTDRLGVLMDSAAYFAAIKAAMLKAQRSIHLLGWAFDPATRLTPDEDGHGVAAGPFLRDVACARPDLDVRVLIWKSALPIAASQHFFPHRARKCFKDTPVHFRLDASVPMGACHHQKVLVIDDALAFCGGGDIGVDRWDSQSHKDDEPRRTMPWGERHGPRHEVMAMVDGPAAAAFGALFRERWRRDCGQAPPEPQADPAEDLWPDFVEPEFENIQIAIARTEPNWRDRGEVREIERLHLEAIAGARRLIYLENQYVTSPLVAEALARRLAEPDGPEVVIISTAAAPSWFDRMTMDGTRSHFLQTLLAADRYGRFSAFCPHTRKGKTIIVHSKVAIIDDRLLRIGSANLNNRSMGFDTECDLMADLGETAEGSPERAAVAHVRARLIGHFLGRQASDFAHAYGRTGSVARAIEALDDGPVRRLLPLRPKPLSPFGQLVATYHLGDPVQPADSWRPWRRKADLEAERLALVQSFDAARLEAGA
jgi:phosphatidylserine/phosphatidylglycerophosphate/cardiolipin synthase-like enzyme